MKMNKQTVNERKSGKQRIMVQLWGPLAKSIDRHFKELHIKRDGYLNDLFTLEIEALATEVTFQNSKEVSKRFRDRPLPDRVKLNLDLDTTLIHRIDEVLKHRNIPRDSFVNRILFFLVANNNHLNYLGIDYDEETNASVKPLTNVKSFLLNPFFYIREENNEAFYTIACFIDGPFGPKGPNLFGLNTAISEESWVAMNIDSDALLNELVSLSDVEVENETN